MKEKKTEEQLKRERKEKALETANGIRMQLITVNKKKNVIFSKLVECKQKGLKEQEAQARNQLRQYLATEKRYEGMLMSIELAMEQADLNDLNISFLKSINELSLSITPPKKSKINMKKTKNNFLKALYNQEITKQKTDEMLDVGDYANAAAFGIEEHSEFDDEIDKMLEGNTNSINNGQRQYF